MQESRYKSWLGVWLPFGLRRIDFYFMRFYFKAFLLILAGLMALVAIGDLIQRFDDFVVYARREEYDTGYLLTMIFSYYTSHVPQLVLQYMLPVIMLLAASITVVSSFAGPRGNNEYIVIRSVGVPVLRAFFPLIFPALLISVSFLAARDLFIPGMVRESQAILNRVRNRFSTPTSVSMLGPDGLQTAAMGWFAPDGVAHNIIVEIRNPEKFQRGESSRGDNNFTAYRAAAARLERIRGGSYQWVPLEKAEIHTYGQFSRRSDPWTEPLATAMTPAMIERQTLGDSVSSWRDLMLMREDNASARFELNWRLADPLACCLLILWGTGFCMARMLRGGSASYIQVIGLSMAATALFYCLRLAGKTLWESGTLSAEAGAWYPVAAAALLGLPIALWMER